jgi:hypothetical protein
VKLNTLVASTRHDADPSDKADQALPLDAQAWPEKHNGGRVYSIPAGRRTGVRLRADQPFLKSSVPVPGKVFDAKRDFGAKGDGTSDDTAAIQQAIDAAREHGECAIAYVPAGRYRLDETLQLRGGGYYFGGAGVYATRLEWVGPEGAPTLLVSTPDHLTICHIGMARRNRAPDILQEATAGGSHVVYDGIQVSKRDTDEDRADGGLVCRGP